MSIIEKPEPIFETERLLVRHFVPDDLDDFAAICADPAVMHFMGDGETLSREEVARWIDICQDKYTGRGYGTSAVFEKSIEDFIGFCGVVRAPDRDFDEIVYAYHQQVWGKGYASEAARAMLTYVFERSVLDTIYATIDPDNTASIKLVTKLGFQFEREELEEDGVRVGYYKISRVAVLGAS